MGINWSAFEKEAVWNGIGLFILYLYIFGLIVGKFIPDWIAGVGALIGAVSTLIFLFQKIIKDRY